MQLVERLEVVRQPVAQVLGLANVDDAPLAVTPLVYARLRGNVGGFSDGTGREYPPTGARRSCSLPCRRIGCRRPILRFPVTHPPFCATRPDCVVRNQSQHIPKELARPRLFALRDLLRRAFGDDGAAAVTAFRPQIDDPIRGFDHVEIVLDDDDGVALVHQSLQYEQQFA